jgi:hypothetical protein
LKQLTLMFSSLLIFGSLVACSSEPAPKADNHENATVAMIREQVKLGLTKEEVENNLGSDYQKVKASDDDSEMWRYDFGTKDGYTSPDNEYDTGDVKGIQNGNLDAQLSIRWTEENTVSSYSVIYLNSGDGRVYDYRVFSDGGEKVQAITK